MATHAANKQRIDKNLKGGYDLVVYGDETTEEWNGLWYNKPSPNGKEISRYWNSTFTGDGGGQFEGLALGIAGDSAPNLIWRLQHGELVNNAKVYWILVGMNDLDKGGCSEEAVTFGILRAAEEISYHNPESVVVIQGILPRSSNKDGSLTAKGHHKHLFHKHHTAEEEAAQARKEFLLWPSIKDINHELEAFCEKNEHFVYFDADKLFLGSQQNAHYKGEMKVMHDLLPDYVHLSVEGHKVLGQAMLEELQRIIYDDDERTDIEDGNS